MNNLSKWKSGTTSENMQHPYMGVRHQLHKAMHDFYDIFARGDTRLENFQNLTMSPAMDLVEEKDRYSIQIEMPGIEEKDVRVSVHGHILSIHAQKSVARKNDTKSYVAREISYGQYTRNVSLPPNADVKGISATLSRSMLLINIPKLVGTKDSQRHIKLAKTSQAGLSGGSNARKAPGTKKATRTASTVKKASGTKTGVKKSASSVKRTAGAKKAASSVKRTTGVKKAASSAKSSAGKASSARKTTGLKKVASSIKKGVKKAASSVKKTIGIEKKSPVKSTAKKASSARKTTGVKKASSVRSPEKKTSAARKTVAKKASPARSSARKASTVKKANGNGMKKAASSLKSRSTKTSSTKKPSSLQKPAASGSVMSKNDSTMRPFMSGKTVGENRNPLLNTPNNGSFQMNRPAGYNIPRK